MLLKETKDPDALPVYKGKLGFELLDDKTIFRLWAPSAERVVLSLYEEGWFSPAYAMADMQKAEDGLWILEINQNLNGTYYTYTLNTCGETYTTQDPWSVSTGVYGMRSLVLDLRTTDPEGWDEDKAPARQSEDIIYELHVKDFTWQRFSGIKNEWRGKFLGLTQKDTHLTYDEECPTGLAYIKSLGVTHVQLMPIYDYGSVDELGDADAFNWGYDPVNYNVPEGSYSTNPERGEVRVRELKEMIKALHENGQRVIMDVVYNHTWRLESALFKTEPWYFYRRNPDGSASNGSGCGCDIASERPMVHRYILESVLYWASEYHIDGFRFDLMGLLDTRLMNDIRLRLDQIYGKGEKLVYGEPWAAGGTAIKQGFQLADKSALYMMNDGIGAFCDTTRDAIKGSNYDSFSAGFVNGGDCNIEMLKNAVLGWAECDWFHVKSPNQTIQYVSSHDDWTLWDKLCLTLDEKEDFIPLKMRLLRANKVAAAMYFTMQGRPFMLSGEEAARTKIGVKNSYNTPIYINRFDWTRTKDAKSLVSYYKGLISLRKNIPALTDKSESARHRLISFKTIGDDTCVTVLDNHGDEKYKRIMIIYTKGESRIRIPVEGSWDVLLDSIVSDRRSAPLKITGEVIANGPEVLLLAR